MSVPHPNDIRLSRLRARFGFVREELMDSFRLDDRWVVMGGVDNLPIESRGSELNAMRAVEALNAHERRNNRPETYTYKYVEPA